MQENRLRKLCGRLLFSMILGMMISAMIVSGKVNFREFFNVGNMVEVSQDELKKSNKSMLYNEVFECYRIQSNKTIRKYLLDGEENAWQYAYINVNKLSVSSVSGDIIYYNRQGEKLNEQPICLIQGENVITLDGTIPMYRMGLKLYDAEGIYISLQSVAVRDRGGEFTGGTFWRYFCLVTAGVYLALVIISFIWKTRIKKLDFIRDLPDKKKLVGWWQQVYQQILACFSGTCDTRKFRPVRIALYAAMFVWIVIARSSGWTENRQIYRYYLLVLWMFFAVEAFLCYEKKAQKKWKANGLLVAWCGYWLGLMLSDVFVVTSFKHTGTVMLFGAGLLIYVWNQSGHVKRFFYEIILGLEITFVPAVLYCALFRPLTKGVQYNGFCLNSEEFSVYVAMMCCIFMTEIFYCIKKKKTCKKYIMYICGTTVAMFFLLRTENKTGVYAVCFYLIILLCNMKINIIRERREIGKLLLGCGIGLLCVVAVHTGTKLMPDMLRYKVTFQNEKLVSGESREVIELLEELNPGTMEGVKCQDFSRVPEYRKAYVHRLGLTGTAKKVVYKREEILPQSGYLYVAYRYGVFNLLPYIVIQVCMFFHWFKLKSTGRVINIVDLMIFGTAIVYVAYACNGNLESYKITPVWLLFYMGAGCWFENEIEKQPQIRS